jgi:hypothetical protein
MKKILTGSFVVCGAMLAVSVYLFLFTFGHWLSWDVSGSIWDVLAAVGTVGATIVALGIALRAFGKERGAVARLVSAWVDDKYVPRKDVSAYTRTAIVHIGNESDEPVFNAQASILAGEPPVRLGPLSLPDVIAVVPQRRSLSFDISVPLRALDNSWNPRVELYFSDANGRRWLRDSNGNLEDVTDAGPGALSAHDFVEAELGAQNLENPLLVAFMFIGGLTEEPFDASRLAPILADEADWESVDWESVRAELASYTATSFAQYPAPRIALVKLLPANGNEGKRVMGEGVLVEGVRHLTLTSSSTTGWRVWGVGAKVRPDDILLPQDAFN